MSDNKLENKTTIAQTGWDTLDSLGDKIIEESFTGIASDLFTAIPMGTLAIGVYKGIRKATELKKYHNFIQFIKTYKSKTNNEISKYLEDHPTSELGDYTLTMINELSSPRQTEMLGRATALLLNCEIDEDLFYEYGYIILKLDPHLYNVVIKLHDKYFKDEQGREDLHKKLKLATRERGRGAFIINPNQDLLSFGFLDANKISIGQAGQEELPQQEYTVNQKYKKFYDQIIIG